MSETSGETPDQPSGEQPPSYPPPAPPAYGQQPYAQQQPPPGGWPPPPPPTQPFPLQAYSYGQPATPYGGAPGYAVPEDKSATTAMVLGIVGLAAGFTVCFGLGFLVSPFALFMGLASKRRIDASGGQLGGRGNAQAGFIMGVLGTIMLALAILALIAIIVLIAVGVSQDSSSFGTGTNA